MTKLLTPELEEFVERELASGNYQSREEVIAAGLQLLIKREQKLGELRAEVQIGLDELDRGAGIVLEDEAAQREFFEDIKRRGREQLNAKKDEQ